MSSDFPWKVETEKLLLAAIHFIAGGGWWWLPREKYQQVGAVASPPPPPPHPLWVGNFKWNSCFFFLLESERQRREVSFELPPLQKRQLQRVPCRPSTGTEGCWNNESTTPKTKMQSAFAFLAVTLVTQEGQLNKGQCPSSVFLCVVFFRRNT